MKSIATALFLCLLTVAANAARPIPGITGAGVKVGFGYATLENTVPEFSDEESFAGGTIGGFLTYSFSPALSVQPELLFVAKGSGGGFIRGRSWRHHYLEIPVLAKFCLSPKTSLRPHLFAGPALAFLLSANFQGSVISDEIDIGDAMKGTDVGIVMGGALEYRRFALDIRYDLGLVNVYDADEWNRLLDAQDPLDIFHMKSSDTVKNRFLAFTLCYRFL